MKEMQKITIERLPKIDHITVDKIDSGLFNFRGAKQIQQDLSSEDFTQLKLSIEKQGIIQPIHVVATENGKYEIVDGNRRLEAARQLGHREIKSFVLEGLTNTQLAAIAISQNINRINLSVEETINSIIAIVRTHYENITEEEIKIKAKQIHNDSPSQDKEFKKIIESIGFVGNSVYQLMQTQTQLTSGTLQRANELNLKLTHRVLLTKGPLKYTKDNKDDYNLTEIRQLSLLEQIKGMSLKQAQELTNSTINYIQQSQNALKQEEDTTDKIVPLGARTEKQKGAPEIGRSITGKYLDLMSATSTFLRCITGYKIGRGQVYYDVNKHVKTLDSKNFRKEIIDNMTELDCKALKHELAVASHAIVDMVKMIEAKYPKELDEYR